MRYLRIAVICLFVVSLGFSAWVDLRYYSSINTDLPAISNNIELLEVSVADDESALLEGLTARDATDGDLTDQIMVAAISHFVEENVVNVKYVVFDAHHNAATLTRKVRYTDYESPRFSMSRAAVIARGSNFDVLSHVKVMDCIDGDISRQIRVINNMVNIYSAGVYPVTMEVTNSCGDVSQLTLWVTVLDKENNAAITLSQYIVYAQQGSEFDPYSYIGTVTDTAGMYLPKEKVQVKGSLDMNTPGTYRLEYSYTDTLITAQTAMTVVVESEGGAL